jgi:hypothetical protein
LAEEAILCSRMILFILGRDFPKLVAFPGLAVDFPSVAIRSDDSGGVETFSVGVAGLGLHFPEEEGSRVLGLGDESGEVRAAQDPIV